MEKLFIDLHKNETGNDKIPKYWQEHLVEKIRRIQDLQKEIGPDCLNFGMITDIHWSHNAHNSAVLLEKVLTDCNIPYFLNGGDVACFAPFGTKAHLKNEFDEYKKAFLAVESKCLIVFGNHDGVYSTLPEPESYAQNITKKERLENGFAFLRKYPNRVFGPDGMYYYCDDVERKVRYILLNTHDVPSDETDGEGRAIYNTFRMFCIREEQLVWLANVALDVPTREWSVVLCSHENATAVSKHKTKNHGLILGILTAFKRGEKFEGETVFDDEPYLNAKVSVDYTGRGGTFIAWLAGHVHEDFIVDEEGIISVSTMNDSCGNASGVQAPHELGSITEQTFDIYTIDKKMKKVYITRIGGLGCDREFSY